MNRVNVFFLLSTAFISAAFEPRISAAQTASDDIKGFWQKGDATNWKASVRATSSTSVVYRDYPFVVDVTKQRDQDQLADPAPKAPQNQPNSVASEPPVSEPNLTREQIVARYGSPDKVSPVRAQKDAPLEMQGLFAALNSGDRELAWQYSVALARRNTEMQNLVAKATDYQLLAMESLGMRAESTLDESKDNLNPNRVELKELMAKTRQEELQRRLDIEGMLAQHEGPEVTDGAVEKTSIQAPQVPVDPEGKVKVLIFFDEKDSSTSGIGKLLMPLKASFKDDPLVSFVGLTKRSYALPALKKISAVSSFPFPLLSGEALAEDLRIQSYPTIILLAVSTKQTHRIEGVESAGQVEQIIRLMQGRQ